MAERMDAETAASLVATMVALVAACSAYSAERYLAASTVPKLAVRMALGWIVLLER